MKNFSDSYKEAGVDVTAGYKAVELMKQHVARTNIPGVVSNIGSFGGLFQPDFTDMKTPILVSGTDGVGTKLRLAFLMDKHDTIGVDCVAMCVNDVICCGAQPLFFLDYLAVGKNFPEKIEKIVSGVADGCVQSNCALVGGETAEMPGFYPIDEYDLAGFCVGMVDREKVIDGSSMEEGDAIIGIQSSGVHSNGFSLVRKVFDVNEENLKQYYEELGTTLGEALLTPTKIYVRPMLSLMKTCTVKAVSHVTGGGFYENLPRMMKEGYTAKIEMNAFPTLPIFDLIQKTGNIPTQDMYTFEGKRRRSFLNRNCGKRRRGCRFMLKIAVLVSGGGTNLQALIDAERRGEIINGEISLVISSKSNAFALERAKNAGISCEVLIRKQYATMEEYDRALIDLLQKHQIDLIVLAGFMTIISDRVIDAYRNKIINVHPSLIPAFCGEGFYGLRVHEAALQRGVKLTGATIHFVNEVCDGGPIILQKAVTVSPDDTAQTLQKRVMEEAEWKLLPQAVSLFCQGKLEIEQDFVKINE